MHIKEGIIPTVLGTVVTATGVALKDNIPAPYRNGIIGFGLAHIALGSVELVGQNIQNKDVMKKVTKAISFR
ncbi:MAG: asparagine synthase [Sedimentibacter sp.]